MVKDPSYTVTMVFMLNMFTYMKADKLLLFFLLETFKSIM